MHHLPGADEHAADRRSTWLAGVAVFFAVVVGAVPFSVVVQAFLVTASEGRGWLWPALFAAAAVSPFVLSGLFAVAGDRLDRSARAAGGLWLGVVVLLMMCMPALGTDIGVGLRGMPW